ncbi:MAG: NGG1p interacting factor NIF3 [Thermoleophilia bacterium]|nr:NGG1p interacting factor NIF3 [Thermoleophilia bacterium]
MKLVDIYNLAVSMGIKTDPRGKREVDKFLKKQKEAYEKLSDEDKELYDTERLTNPFADTRILSGDFATEVKAILAGIDMEAAEIMLADRLREKGRRVDLVMSHHPEGKALAALADVMDVQADIWHKAGVPINVGEAVLEGRQAEVGRLMLSLNHQRPVQTAHLLGLPFMCCHTPTDNLVANELQKFFDRRRDLTLGDVRDDLKKNYPEYREAARQNAGPTIVVGKESRRAGKVLVDMTGGTGGPSESMENLAQAGVGTLVGMHISEKNREAAEKHKINVVIAGHNASDSLGINLFLDELEKKGVEIIPCSGLFRVSRLRKPAKRTARKSTKKK